MNSCPLVGNIPCGIPSWGQAGSPQRKESCGVLTFLLSGFFIGGTIQFQIFCSFMTLQMNIWKYGHGSFGSSLHVLCG